MEIRTPLGTRFDLSFPLSRKLRTGLIRYVWAQIEPKRLAFCRREERFDFGPTAPALVQRANYVSFRYQIPPWNSDEISGTTLPPKFYLRSFSNELKSEIPQLVNEVFFTNKVLLR